MANNKEDVLGVGIDSNPVNRLLRKICYRLENDKKFYIVTPNPEIIMLAQSDELLKKALNEAEISIPDGIGVVGAIKFLSLLSSKKAFIQVPQYVLQGLRVGFSIFFNRDWLTEGIKVIKGRDMFLNLVKIADKRGLKVVLLGNRQKSAQKAMKKLEIKFKNVRFYAYSGPIFDRSALPKTDKEKRTESKIIKNINIAKPDFVFVGFGAPRQEKWVSKWIGKLNTKCMMVVGGTFDYVSGTRKPIPEWIEELNLEWLWRLLTGSQKLKRVYKAVPMFPLRVFWKKLQSP